MTEPYKVHDLQLAAAGERKIAWATAHMPVMAALQARYAQTQPLRGQRIAGCLHVTKETAVLIRALRAAGAEVNWSGCNPLSTQNDVAAALATEGVGIYAWHGQSTADFYWCIDLTLDDGADLIMRVHSQFPELARTVVGGSEETTTGVHRLRAMAKAGKLRYPVLAINDAITKWDFDNVYGTGQSSMDGILRATSVLVAGKTVVIAGYGHCGRGCAVRAKGMGANTIVTEVDPQAALKATLDGHRVMTMDAAAAQGDIFITATGMRDVIGARHFAAMRDGAIVCNTGHYDCELNLVELGEMAQSRRPLRPNCEEYLFADGRRMYVLAQGRLVNLAAAEGHPSEVMDMSFANQFMGMLHMAAQGKAQRPGVVDISPAQDQEIARLKLQTMGIQIDSLTAAQKTYADDYMAGT